MIILFILFIELNFHYLNGQFIFEKCFEYYYNKQKISTNNGQKPYYICNDMTNHSYYNQKYLSPKIFIIILDDGITKGKNFNISFKLNINEYLIEKMKYMN